MTKIFNSPSNDSEMEHAARQARKNFKFFWREMTWEYRRIIPAMGIASVKIRFDEGDTTEYLWANVFNFDGINLYIEVLNTPNELKKIKANDQLTVPFEQLYDWLYSLDDEIFGGFTVNLMRKRMSSPERASHDGAWGLNFGDPNKIDLVPLEWLREKKKRIFGKPSYKDPNEVEHPMALNMVQGFKEGKFGKEVLEYVDDLGKTTLHDMALGGAAEMTIYLLNQGMDKTVKDNNGNTPLFLSNKMGWGNVSKVLEEY
ncbi:MAG: DUF2314 domain-containing protein [Hellea sp.]